MYSFTHALIRYYQPHLLFPPERQIVAFVENHIKGKRLLDAGCGNGWLSLAFARKGYQVISLDIARNCILQTRNGFHFFGLTEYRIVQASITDIPLRTNSIDTIICISVLEHVTDIVKALRELNRILVPAGRLIVLVPNKLTFGRIYDRLLYKCLPAQNILRKAYRAMFGLSNNEALALGLNEVPIGHQQELLFEDVITLFTKNNFRIIDYRNYRLFGPYFRSLTNFIGTSPVTLLERFDLKIAQKVQPFLATEWLFCCEKII
jgi:ubiquinone/menaquinone biosynthesis C-methylase UbiE